MFREKSRFTSETHLERTSIGKSHSAAREWVRRQDPRVIGRQFNTPNAPRERCGPTDLLRRPTSGLLLMKPVSASAQPPPERRNHWRGFLRQAIANENESQKYRTEMYGPSSIDGGGIPGDGGDFGLEISEDPYVGSSESMLPVRIQGAGEVPPIDSVRSVDRPSHRDLPPE